MTRSPRILLIAVAALLLAASCGQSRTVDAGATAATIRGIDDAPREIPRGEVEEVVQAVTGSERFMESVFGGTLPEGFRQTVLTQLIQLETMEALLAEEGGEVTAEDRTEIEGLLEDELEGLLAAGGAEGETDQVMEQIAPYTTLLVERNAHLTALGRALTAGEEAQTQEVACVRHILQPEEAQAEETIAELEGGAEFEALAAERSLDPGSGAQGGDLGCAPSDRYVPEFAEAVDGAEIDELVGPVETQFGFHIIQVYDRQEEELPSEGPARAGEAISERLREAEIEVSPELGRWDPEALLVVPA